MDYNNKNITIPRESKRIYVCSDLHMMDGSNRDDFAPYREQFITSLSRINEDEIVILNGDIFDIWRAKYYFSITSYYSDVINYLSKFKNLIIIAGNHDGKIEGLKEFLYGMNVYQHVIVNDWFITHGHLFDMFNYNFKWIGKFLTEIGNWIGMFSHKMEDFINDRISKIKKIGRYSIEDIFINDVEEFVKNFHGVNGIICGHTHRFKHEKLIGGKTYHNCGTYMIDGWSIFQDNQFIGNLR